MNSRIPNEFTVHYGPVFPDKHYDGVSLTICKVPHSESGLVMTETEEKVDCKNCLRLLGNMRRRERMRIVK